MAKTFLGVGPRVEWAFLSRWEKVLSIFIHEIVCAVPVDVIWTLEKCSKDGVIGCRIKRRCCLSRVKLVQLSSANEIRLYNLEESKTWLNEVSTAIVCDLLSFIFTLFVLLLMTRHEHQKFCCILLKRTRKTKVLQDFSHFIAEWQNANVPRGNSATSSKWRYGFQSLDAKRRSPTHAVNRQVINHAIKVWRAQMGFYTGWLHV